MFNSGVRAMFAKLFYLLLLAGMISCTPADAPQEDPNITNNDLIAEGKILLPIQSIQLVYPIKSPGYTPNPVIRINGVRPSSLVKVYPTASCNREIAIAQSMDSFVDITMPTLTKGRYTFYAKQYNQYTESPCSSFGLQYEFINSIPVPSNVELVSPASSPSFDTNPIFRVSGVKTTSTVTLFSDEECSIALGYAFSTGSNIDIQINNLSPGIYKVYANQLDSGGNLSECSEAYADYELQTNLDAPTSITLKNPLNSPSSDKTPEFTISPVIAGNTVEIFRDPSCQIKLGGAVAATTSVDVTTDFELQEGVYQVFARQKSVSETSTCSSTYFTYIVNTSTSDISNVQLLSPVSTPNQDSTPKLRIFGTEPGASITVYINNTCTVSRGSVTGGVSGYTDITLTPLSQGPHLIYVKQTSFSGGNTTSCEGPFLTYTVDTIVNAPSGIVLKNPLFSPSSDATPEVTVQGVENGAVVSVYKNNTCSQKVGQKISTGTSVDIVVDELSLGSHTLYAKQIDAAGNVSSCSLASVAYQVLGSSVQEPSSITLNSPSLNPNSVTDIIVGIAGVSNGATAYLYFDSVCSTPNLIGSALVSGNSTVIPVNGLQEGVHTFYAKQIDASGNISNCSNASMTYEVDLSSPAPTSISLVQPAQNISSDSTPTINVSGLEPGGTVKVYKDNLCVNQIASTQASGTSANVNLNLSSAGNYNFYAKQVDSLGNTSPCSVAFLSYTLVLGNNIPSGIVMVDPVGTTGNDPTPTVKVEGVNNGSDVYVYKDVACVELVGQAQANGSSVNITLNDLGSDGVYSLYARQRVFGELTACTDTPLNYTLDTSASAPTGISLVNPASSPGADDTPTLKVSGVENGATVKIFSNSSCSVEMGTATASGSDVNITTKNSLADGTYTFYARQIDAVGNISACSTANVTYVLSTGASKASSLSLFDPATSPGSDTTPTITVSGIENGATVTIYTSSTCVGTSLVGTAVSSGTSVNVVVSSPLSIGTYTFYAKQQDIDNNVSACSDASVTYQVSVGVSDPLYDDQWHLDNTGQMGGTVGEDLNIDNVWSTNKGTGIHTRIVDDGLEIAHPDLTDNIKSGASVNVLGGGDPTPVNGGDAHGTACGGIVSARDNSIGVRGVAPRGLLSGYNYLQSGTLTHEVGAMQTSISTVDVSSNSWGPVDGVGQLVPPPSQWESAVETGLSTGRGGKGTVYVWAAGNGAQGGDNSNHDGYANFYGVMAICGINKTTGKYVSYSEPGANLWVCAPTDDIATTDLAGSSRGYNVTGSPSEFSNRDYTKVFNGTSASAPMVSGAAALILKANPNLSWRDVKLIIAQSARKNYPSSGGANEDTWVTNGAGFNINHDYGFGAIDVKAAVNLAATWTNVGTLQTDTETRSVNQALGNGTGQSSTSVTVSSSPVTKIEFIEVTVNATHPNWGDLEIILERDGGSFISYLTKQHDCFDPQFQTLDKCTVSGGTFRFGVSRHLGESANGTWFLKVSDKKTGADSGTLNSWTIKFYGE
jgi:proprotein convertase subtilisin/kexin type 2